MRRQFLLPANDLSFLEDQGIKWETIIDRGMHWVMIHQHPVPGGYNVNYVTIAIKIETGYPRVALDMAYFYPPLSLLCLKSVQAAFEQVIDRKFFQRWSRHRTIANPWRPGLDDLSTHVSLVNFWLEQELFKGINGITA